MLEMRYVDSKERYHVAFHKLSDHIVELMGDFPVEISGFLMSRIGKTMNGTTPSTRRCIGMLTEGFSFQMTEVCMSSRPNPFQ